MKLLWRSLVSLAVISAVTACAQPMNKATTGALTGSALGAGLGAIVGSQSGHAGPGVAIGAAAGALGGALIGNTLDNTDRERMALEERVNRQNEELEENRRLIEELRRRGAEVRSSNRGVIINLPDILFEFDKSSLTREARRTIQEISGVLRNIQRPISVEGHTDSIGSVAYNQRLSLRRAESVANELSRNGIPYGQISTRGYGEAHPIATNNSDAGRARNRRVEVIVENVRR